MLAAARNKAAICRLLLAAGVDAALLDPSGRDALCIAQAVGANDAALAIQAALVPPPSVCPGRALDEPALACNARPEARTRLDQSGIRHTGVVIDTADAIASTLAEKLEHVAPSALSMAGAEAGGFDLSGWEAEADQVPPESDTTVAAVEAQTAISEHQPIDTSADWEDFEAFLPDRATPLLRAEDAEAREGLRMVLLRAIREGSVPHSALEDLTSGHDGEPDAVAGSLLVMVVNDLGAETDERIEYSAPHESFEVFVSPNEKPGEDDAVAEALAFIDELAARRNEPLRIYQREIQRADLLNAEAEVALGQAMESGIEKALDALAAWPSGVDATLKAARQVAEGARPLRWLSIGTQIELPETQLPSTTTIDADADPDEALEQPATRGSPADSEDESDPQSGPDAKDSSIELAELRTKVEILSGATVGASQNAPEWAACRSALASLGLSRGFLMELAESCLTDETAPARAFGLAMQA